MIYNSKIQKMIARNLSISDLKFIPFRKQTPQSNNNTRRVVPSQLTNSLAQRNTAIQWLFRAQHNLKFSRSTLFLGISLLDKLLTYGMPLNDENWELIVGSILLIATKFNEVYPVTIRKLNALSHIYYHPEKYIETEANLLTIVKFDLSPEDPIYQQLAELQHKLGQQSEDIIKLAVLNPSTAFKQGSSALLSAIQAMSTGGLTDRTNGARLSREGVELKAELQRLRSKSPSLKRMVSPSRA